MSISSAPESQKNVYVYDWKSRYLKYNIQKVSERKENTIEIKLYVKSNSCNMNVIYSLIPWAEHLQHVIVFDLGADLERLVHDVQALMVHGDDHIVTWQDRAGDAECLK